MAVVPFRQRAEGLQNSLPPYAEQLAILTHRHGYSPREAIMLATAARLSAAAKDQGGWFYMPQSRAPKADGGLYDRAGGWRELGCGSERTQRRIRMRLTEERMLENRQPGLGRANYYRVDLDRYHALFILPSEAPKPEQTEQPLQPFQTLTQPSTAPFTPAAGSPTQSQSTDIHVQEPLRLPADVLARIDEMADAPHVRCRAAYRRSLIQIALKGSGLDMYVAPGTESRTEDGNEAVQRDPQFEELAAAMADVRHWRELAELSPSEPPIREALLAAERRLAEVREQRNTDE